MSVAQNLASDRSVSGTSHLSICTGRVQETHDVFTLAFERIDGQTFNFVPGQFVMIRFSWDGQIFSRIFTIAAPPTRPERISLTIKAATDGKATRILHDHFHEGCGVEISEARGEFTLHGRTVEKALFLCAGSGITPLMSMVRTLHDLGEELDLCLIQCSRTASDVLFGQELAMLSRSMPKLRVETVFSRPSDLDSNRPGRLNKSQLALLVPDASDRTAFVCGPTGFMAVMRGHLLELGIPADRIFEEAFGPRPATTTKISAGEKAVVSFERSGFHVEADEDTTILNCAETAGIHIETACQMGLCGTCKVKLTRGEVDMSDMGGLSEVDCKDGFILACCSRPRGHVAVDL